MNLLVAVVGALLVTASLAPAVHARQPEPLARVSWLRGDWVGIGEGEPGRSATERHIQCAIQCSYLRVDGRSVYPRQEKNAKGELHVAMDIWSFDRARKKLVLRTFDSLGLVTTYVQDDAASSDTRLVLVAEHLENVPAGWRARYTYTFNPPDEYHELFELAMKGKQFSTYVDNRFLRVEKAD